MEQILSGVYSVGVFDKNIDLFEGMYSVPEGISYNSYLVCDKKIAIMDSVDANFRDEWLNNIHSVLGERKPDYLVILHMEPDHSANILSFIKAYPDAQIVGNAKTLVMIKEFFGEDFSFNFLEVQDGQSLDLGGRKLNFIFAPMVHWPEVMVAYDSVDKALFSADAFGKFGAWVCGKQWESEARRYYYGIVGKFGAQVQILFKKLSCLEIKKIFPLHGPFLTENVDFYFDKYEKWSKYEPETNGVLIAYTSIYGHTASAAKTLALMLKEKNVCEVELCDLARCDWAECVAQAFKFKNTVLATTTYNGDVFPAMREFIDRLKERNFQNRRIGLIENGSWAPVAARNMQKRLEGCKNLEYCENGVKIRSALNAESTAQLERLAYELSK